MTLDEATLLDLGIMAADDDALGEKVLPANQKTKNLIAQ